MRLLLEYATWRVTTRPRDGRVASGKSCPTAQCDWGQPSAAGAVCRWHEAHPATLSAETLARSARAYGFGS